MRQSHLGKVAMVLLPALFVAILAILFSDTRIMVLLSTVSVLGGLTVLAVYVIRSNTRLQDKQESIYEYVVDSRIKQSKKEYEILDELSRQRKIVCEMRDALRGHADADIRYFKELEERLAEMFDSISSSNEQIVRDLSTAYSGDEATKRNRLAVQALFTRMLKGQDDISKRLNNLESRSTQRETGTDGEYFD